ncbi:hypothetical protein TIFTF001_022970 [Ficus carica]|uniref:Mitotic checkpoint serine/threonine-protein kinase BUB1 n=1 Tax=Ficus carica TaxID=3494 RepID=A0AA88AIS8_FICCA|nr:hypothetical protein TIFTF001_022970 [Ficus carica]
MAVLDPESQAPTSLHDPLFPWLRLVNEALEDLNSGKDSDTYLAKTLSDCIKMFKDNAQYRDDIRFLKIWFLYIGLCEDFDRIFTEILEKKICVGHSLLYVWYATFLESKGKLYDAQMVYQMGILRNAEPVEWLKKAHGLFLERMSDLVNDTSLQKVCQKEQDETEKTKGIDILQNDGGESIESEESYINPWSSSTIKDLVKKITSQITKYEGCHSSSKAYPGKVALASLPNSSRNKFIEIGGKKYQIKGCAGQGGFAKVYKAYVNSNPDEIQKPPFPWEFYMYRQLDHRISAEERLSFGFAHRVHLYSDCSVLVCDYLANGTLQDAINSYVVVGKSMEEVLCIYYTIEMLCMLEALHGAGIIHGDFKPDNMLIRYARADLLEDAFPDRSGAWRDQERCLQGLCLVDWGRGIDLQLFPGDTKFKGDCRTSGFRCVEMQQNKPWKFQATLYFY